jgi:hypothetical protein
LKKKLITGKNDGEKLTFSTRRKGRILKLTIESREEEPTFSIEPYLSAVQKGQTYLKEGKHASAFIQEVIWKAVDELHNKPKG